MKPGKQVVETLVALPDHKAERIVREMDPGALRRLLGEWPAWVHEGQEAPERGDWRVWVMLAGRNFGKTRAGAEWISQMARDYPKARIALVAATADEARRVMIEGQSGLLAVAGPGERPTWEPSRGRLAFPSGAVAQVYSGANGEALRGPEHHFAWCDELAKWKQAQGAWDNLMLGLRLGETPRVLVTTTPKPLALLKALIADSATERSGGPSAANPHASAAWQADMKRRMGGTRLGRQELDGVLFDDADHALWGREAVEQARRPAWAPAFAGELSRIVIGVDPPASAGGTCGIIACGMDADGHAYVLADHSIKGGSPNGWARKVAAAFEIWGADRVVAEKNNGGDMVGATLASVEPGLPVRLVSASRGKAARAEPIAARFEARQAWFAGHFPELEDELCQMTVDGYRGAGSPDRADAMMSRSPCPPDMAAQSGGLRPCSWAMTELFRPRAEPRVRVL